MVSDRTRTVLVALLFATVVLLAGCTTALNDDSGDDQVNNESAANGEDPAGDGEDAGDSSGAGEYDAVEENVSAEQLQTDSLAAMEDVETAAMKTEMTMTADSQQILDMTSDGVVDYTEEKMELDVTMQQAGIGEMTVPQYVVEDTNYMEIEGQWVKEDASEQEIWESDELSQQQEILDGATLDVVGQTTVDTHDTYVVESTLDSGTMSEIMEDEFDEEEAGLPSDAIEVSETTVTQYIDMDSSHVRQTAMEFDMTTAGETMTVEMTINAGEFNEPVDIELPNEAEDATPAEQQTV